MPARVGERQPGLLVEVSLGDQIYLRLVSDKTNYGLGTESAEAVLTSLGDHVPDGRFNRFILHRRSLI